jgi:hypothetical protein
MNTLKMTREKTLLCAIILSFLLLGCKTTNSSVNFSKITPPAPPEIKAPAGALAVNPGENADILSRIEERNRTIEDDQEWLKKSYDGLMVRRLSNISEKEYEDYIKYLDNGIAYIIVHPAYFPFFHRFKRLSKTPEDGPYPTENVVEKFLSLKPKNARFSVLQAQERRMRDFIEYKATQEKLVILVIPRNYYKFKGYIYKKGMDEYMRYLNEISNFSKSVLFVQSRSPNKGYVTEEDSIRLMEFLLTIDAKALYVGGGYVGRCLENFYANMTEDFGQEDIYLVPELADISPAELPNSLAKRILKKDGTLDTEMLTRLLEKDAYKVQEVLPKVRNLD